MSIQCCPLTPAPCDGLVVDVFPPIVLVAVSGILTSTLLQFLPETQNLIPTWGVFLIKFIVQLLIGYLIQNIAGVRNMWKAPTNSGILASLFLMIFTPLFLPIVLKVL